METQWRDTSIIDRFRTDMVIWKSDDDSKNG